MRTFLLFLRRTLPLLLAASPLALATDGTTQTIALSGTSAPNQVGNFTFFGNPFVNGSGNVAFVGQVATGSAIYKTAGTNLVTIVKKGDAIPILGGVGGFSDFVHPMLNESGLVAFFGYGTQSDASGLKKGGIFTGIGDVNRTLNAIAVYGQTSVGLGLVTEFGNQAPSLGDNGSVAFVGRVSDGPGDTTEPTGLFVGASGGLTSATTIDMTTQPLSGITFTSLDDVVQNNTGVSVFTGGSGTSTKGIYAKLGSTLNTIATNQQAPGGIAGNFKDFTSVGLNNKGTVTFMGTTSTDGSIISGSGVFTGSGGTLTAVATTTTPVPGSAGSNFSFFPEGSVISNSGVVSFRAHTTSGTRGIYAGSSIANLKTVATTLQGAPMLGGNFAEFSNLAVNDIGTVAFIGMNSTSLESPRGIYLSDGQEIITAAYSGQTVSGNIITDDGLSFVGGADRGSGSQINNNGQVSYHARLDDGRQTVLLFTPTLHFRTPTAGSWATRSNWTVGILPASVHDVVIDPGAALSVTGPALPTTVKSLSLGTSAGGAADLVLQSAGTITATGGASTLATGRIRGNGRLIGNLSNAGTIAPGLPSAAGLITLSGNVTLQPTSHLALDLGGLVRKTNYDYLSISGTLSLGGSLDVSLLGGFTPLAGNSFDLFDAPVITGSFSSLNLPSLTAGLAWNTSLLSTTGALSVSATGPVISTWNLNGGGSWSTSFAGNWTSGVPNGNSASATFGPIATSAATINVDGGPVTVGAITFTNSNSYTVGGPGAITLADSSVTPTISVTLGSHTISAPLVLAQNATASTAGGTTLTIAGSVSGGTSSLTKTGTGILNLDGTQTYAALNASAGTTNVDGAVGTGATAVSVTGAGTTLKFGSVSQTLSSLTIGAGSTVIFTSGAASFLGGGKAPELGGGAVVPEPGSLGLLVTGALGLLARRRRMAAR